MSLARGRGLGKRRTLFCRNLKGFVEAGFETVKDFAADILTERFTSLHRFLENGSLSVGFE